LGLTFDEVARAVRATLAECGRRRSSHVDGNFQLQARNLADTETRFRKHHGAPNRRWRHGARGRRRDGERRLPRREPLFAHERRSRRHHRAADRRPFNIWETAAATSKPRSTRFRAQLPAGVQITTIYNEVEDYNSLLGILFSNAGQGFLLIFVLLLLTLHPKVAFWATLGVMTAFAGSFFILPYLGVSLNFMSVFGFLLVLGIMVDDAIIVGEAIYERAERGHTGVDASIYATQWC
jgi:hypothetical protein